VALCVYTVHRARGAAPATAELVPEGFAWGAALLGPLWLAWRGLWFGLIVWVCVAIFLGAIGLAFDLAPAERALLGLVEALGFGLFGHDLARVQHALRGRALVDVVTGHDEEEALVRLFARDGGGGSGLLARLR
jgi:hypothetical protein